MKSLGRGEHREAGEQRGDSADSLTDAIIGAAIAVHEELGPGLLETTYEACLEHELQLRGRRVERQKSLPVKYRGINLEFGYRVDLLVEDAIIVEVKAAERLTEVHEAQLLTYLRLSGKRVDCCSTSTSDC